MKNQLITEIKLKCLPARVSQLDKDFLDFEFETASTENLQLILTAITNKVQLKNPFNSCIIYATGLSDDFNFKKGRADTKGGSPPDIDLDIEALERKTAVEACVARWGRDHVANIATMGTWKPKSLTRRFFAITEGDTALMHDILDKFPPPFFGKEPTLKEIIEGNEEKNYLPHPELLAPKYAAWYKFCKQLEQAIEKFGFHAGGLVISDFPIYEQVPMWLNTSSERITQFDMHEVEELGLIKFDMLAINNLDILKECVRLIKLNQDIEINLNKIPDFDTKTYQLLATGMLSGIFQMETGSQAKELILKIAPSSISELSDISALNRPGPLENGFDVLYIENKKTGRPPADMHPLVADLIKETYWTIVYQEQVMNIVSKIGGFTMKEADDVRRAMGKKKLEALLPYKQQFIAGGKVSGLTITYAESLWAQLIEFSNYGFNKSHSLAYSVLTYWCAYLKANYPVEFFAALMSIKSKTTMPKDWAQEAPIIVQEAKNLGVHIHGPSVQRSGTGFTIHSNDVYFGFNGVKNIGAGAAKQLMSARGDKVFNDIWDFIFRINTTKVNTKVFEALVNSGSFDRMGYRREDLLENMEALYGYRKETEEYAQRVIDAKTRTEENILKANLKAKWDTEILNAKSAIKEFKKQQKAIPAEIQAIAEREEKVRILKARVAEGDPELILSKPELDFLNYYLALRKKPELKIPEYPSKPDIKQAKTITLSVQQLITQADYIGCYLGKNPASIIFPQAGSIIGCEDGDYSQVAGIVTKLKVIQTKAGEDMAFMAFADGTAIAEAVIFPKLFRKLKNSQTIPDLGDIIQLEGRTESIEPIKFIADKIETYRRTTNDND